MPNGGIPNTITSVYADGYDINSCPDGAGGVWVTTKMGGNHVGVEHVNQDGIIAEWGIVNAFATINCWRQKAIQADNGDLILIVREIAEEDPNRNYATFQRINKEGERLWGEDGIRFRDDYASTIGFYRGPIPGTYMFESSDLVLIDEDGEEIQVLASSDDVSTGQGFKIISSDSCVISGIQFGRYEFKLLKIRYDGEWMWGQDPVIFDGVGLGSGHFSGTSDM
jgi:hypothetical protein